MNVMIAALIDAAALLIALRTSGIHIWLENDLIRLHGPRPLMTPAVCDAVTQQRAALKLWLQAAAFEEMAAGLEPPPAPAAGLQPLTYAGLVGIAQDARLALWGLS